MNPVQYMLAAAFVFFGLTGLFTLIRLLVPRAAHDPAEPKGKAAPAMIYALTLAMSPLKKETGNKHWATYAAGVFFHFGIFLAFKHVVFLFFDIPLPNIIKAALAAVFIAAGLCGAGILIKRMVLPKMRALSNPDDYFSNLLVTGFLILSFIAVFYNGLITVLYGYTAFLFLYMPFGKLKHAVYFVPARLYLGLFYGKRGVWPPPKEIQ